MSDVVWALRTGQRPFDYLFYNQVRGAGGLYGFWLRSTCLYVGMSENLRRRIAEHCKNEANVDLKTYVSSCPGEIMISIVYVDASADQLRRLESAAIRELRPVTNYSPNAVRYT